MATSVLGSRTQHQHGTHSAPHHRGRPTKHRFTGAGRYVLNDVIARDLCIETVQEFIQRIARRMYDCTTSPTRALMNSSGISHRCARGCRVADPSPENFSRRLPPKELSGLKSPTPAQCGREPLTAAVTNATTTSANERLVYSLRGTGRVL
ncbi:hypothetical protein EVAR_15860_1 [Eumeta japonica]|uniref:Uncharacterized protein n=1 Tax=Eumeta variegata TaxID=151549 RepID=A0A4C1UFG4_EUMVA|nr:hypothetical protein EVAR_15860_1 [Eumeta japonica]